MEVPAEEPGSATLCGKLLRHMYGTRAAADGWHSEYAPTLVEDLGFQIGNASACVFYHETRGLRCSVHGGDLTTGGLKDQLCWCKRGFEKVYELTGAHRLGPSKGDDKEAQVLNRIVRWTASGVECEADPKQAEKLLRDLEPDEGVKGVGTRHDITLQWSCRTSKLFRCRQT